MINSSFYFHWRSFLLGFILSGIGFVITLFAKADRRDKIYSALMGWFLGVGLLLLLMYLGMYDMEALKN